MSSLLILQFLVIFAVAIIALYAGNITNDSSFYLVIPASALASFLTLRYFDRIALRSSEVTADSLMAWVLRGASVEHRGDVDLVRLGKKYYAIASLEVLDSWHVQEVLEPQSSFSLVRSLAEYIGSTGSWVQIEIVKPLGENDPRFRFLVISKGSGPEQALAKVKESARVLEQSLSGMGMVLRRARCGTECEITGLTQGRSSEPMFSRIPFIAQMAVSVFSIAVSGVLAPNVAGLVAILTVPSMICSLLNLSRLSPPKGPSLVPQRLAGKTVSLKGGRLVVGGTRYSFFTIRKFENYDRVVAPEDLHKLLGLFNHHVLYNPAISFAAVIALKEVEEVLYVRKESLKMDMAQLDYETGGGLSRKRKATVHETRLERMRVFGEKPFTLAGVFMLKVPKDSDPETLESAVKSSLSLVGVRVQRVTNPLGVARCLRTMYITPSFSLPIIESPSVTEVVALTNDFGFMTPFALDRVPLTPSEGILIGVDRRGRKVHWNPMAVRNAHMMVFGPMGSGKSTLVRTIILRASEFYTRKRGYPPAILIVDPAGEYQKIASLLGGHVVNLLKKKVNPLCLSGASPLDRTASVVELLRYTLQLKGEEVSELKDAVLEAYRRAGIDTNDPSTWVEGRDRDVTMTSVYHVLEERHRVYSQTRDPMLPTVKSLLEKLMPLAKGARALDRTDITVEELISYHGVLVLSLKDEFGEMSLSAQRVVVWSILQQLRDYLVSLNVQEDLRVIAVVDEAHRYLALGEIVEGGVVVEIEPPISLHLRDTRKFGAAYVLITHEFKDLPEGTVGLVGTTIALSSTNHEYLEWAARVMGLSPSDLELMSRGEAGGGFMITLEDPRPLFIRVIPEKEAMVRDAVAERRALLMERSSRVKEAVAKGSGSAEAEAPDIPAQKSVAPAPRPQQVQPAKSAPTSAPELVPLPTPQPQPVQHPKKVPTIMTEIASSPADRLQPAPHVPERREVVALQPPVAGAKSSLRTCPACSLPIPAGFTECPICAVRKMPPEQKQEPAPKVQVPARQVAQAPAPERAEVEIESPPSPSTPVQAQAPREAPATESAKTPSAQGSVPAALPRVTTVRPTGLIYVRTRPSPGITRTSSRGDGS